MKFKFTLILFSICFLTNCSLDKDIDNQEITIIEWHLVKVTGCIAGLEQDFELNTIIWRFDNINSKLIVKNNNTDNTDDSLEDGLDTGTYDQLLIDENDKLFLLIDNIDYGLTTISEDEQTFTLDQNMTSNGNGADGFIYLFEKQIIIID